MRWIRVAIGLLLIAVVVACDHDEAEVPGPIVRDSAGVRIVDNGEVPAAEWRVGVEPLVSVGWDEDDPMFTWVQSGRLLPDGGALVADFTTGTLYEVGADGSVVQTRGRKGEGPGEYQALDAVLARGDSIVVSDGRLGRLTFLAPDGSVRTVTMPAALTHAVSAALADGRFLLVPGEGYGAVAETRPEWVFETQPILAMHPGENSVDTLAELPHLRRWYGTRGASPGPVHVKGRAGGFADGFAWARSDEREVRWYDSSGRLSQLSRWNEEPVPFTRETRSHLIQTLEETFRSINDDDAFVATQLAPVQELLDRYQGPLPYWDSFKVDRLGSVWLSAYTLHGEPRKTEWRVFARDGTVVGWIDLPETLNILDITDDRILAVRSDGLDVPGVVVLDLIKP